MLEKTGIELRQLATPKLSVTDPSRHFYKYYAGFSEAFVEDILRTLRISNGQKILDPWNGAGTTTYVASTLSLQSYGYDLNPALVVIGKARVAKASSSLDFFRVLSNGLRRFRGSNFEEITQADPLNNWFGQTTIARLRSFEAKLRSLIPENTKSSSINSLSAEEALVYLVLFRSVRTIARRALGSNPTWVRKLRSRRIGVSKKILRRVICNELDLVRDYFTADNEANHFAKPVIGLASSTALSQVGDSSIDLIIGSPPYCTRIDYAVATSLELAVLWKNFPNDFRELRSSLIGTTLTLGDVSGPSPDWGVTCGRFLDNVQKHKSKASQTYYYRYFARYFFHMLASFRELGRVSKKRSQMVIVVQSSFYKEIYLDLATIFVEILASQGWSLEYRQDFAVSISFTNLNPSSKLYRRKGLPVESALIFRKE